jgi:hypothetical protein
LVLPGLDAGSVDVCGTGNRPCGQHVQLMRRINA